MLRIDNNRVECIQPFRTAQRYTHS